MLAVPKSVFDPAAGSYDDHPEHQVSTVLAIPLRLLSAPAKPQPQVPPQHRRVEDHQPLRATVTIGLLAAAIVFTAAAAVLAAAAWLVR